MTVTTSHSVHFVVERCIATRDALRATGKPILMGGRREGGRIEFPEGGIACNGCGWPQLALASPPQQQHWLVQPQARSHMMLQALWVLTLYHLISTRCECC
jgi:hypothetical protein